MSFKIKVNGLKELRKRFAEAPKTTAPLLKKGIIDSAKVIVRAEIKEAPTKTGNLRRTISFKYKPIQATIKPNAKYAYWVHEGTGVYAGRGMITPKKGNVLAWRQNGKWVFARKTKGQKGNPFVERAWRISKRPIQTIFGKMLKNIVDKL